VRKLLRRLVVLGAIAGAVYAARSYLRGESAPTGTVQIVFDDGSTRSLASNTTEGNEFIDTGQKLIQIGL